MDSLFFTLALIAAGAALVTGLNGILIGVNKESDRVDLVFGIQSILLFVFLVMPPVGFIPELKPPYPFSVDLKRFFLWCFYSLFPVFFKGYSGYRNKFLETVFYFTSAASYLLLLATNFWEIDKIFRVGVLVPLSIIGIIGFRAAHFQAQQGERVAAKWLTFAMAVYVFLLSVQIPFFVAADAMENLTGIRSFSTFNLNPLAFILIMSFRLRRNINAKYGLEHSLRIQNSRWEKLLHSIKLLVIEVDREGIIRYINPYGMRCLGASTPQQCVEKNWFNSFVKAEDREKLRALFNDVIDGKTPLPEVKINVVGLDGLEHHVNWTSVKIQDDEGRTIGLMSIGVDTTELDEAFRQVEDLKDELAKENVYLKETITDDKHSEIIGKSEAIIYALQKARQVAATHATVLLEGETGVGKELFANLIHQLSDRNSKPIIKVNCAALPDDLIESELFGHEKGSFTGALQARKGRFELADGGTIFLDEISELPLALQAKLLRVLQSGEFERIGGQQTIRVNVRVISAVNRDLMNDVKQGRFREDLYYRLNVYPITIPALRKRKSDIPLLVNHYIRKFSFELNKDIRNISKADMNRLMDYDWPGNIRELINLIERSMITSAGDTLRIDWERNQNGNGKHEDEHLPLSIKSIERDHILRVLKETGWKINGSNGAAEKLGLNPNTLRSRMKKLNILRNESQ